MSLTNKFIGWAQYTKDEFEKLSFTQKTGRLIFVRDIENNICKHSQIYFGSRLYAEVNSENGNGALNSIISNIISSLGKNVSANGTFIPFDLELYPIIGGKNNITDAIIALELSINNLIKKIEKIETSLKIEGDDL